MDEKIKIMVEIASQYKFKEPMTAQGLLVHPDVDFSIFKEEPSSTSKQIVRSCCKNIDHHGNKICDAFKSNLQALYKKNLSLPTVVWWKQEHNLEILHFFTLQLNGSEKQINIEEIFNSVDNKPPLRILIVGQSEFVNISFATKLVRAWEIKKKYMDHFKFVFFLPLHKLQQRSIEDILVEIGQICGCNDVMEILHNHMENTLLILDGFDKALKKTRREILDIWHKQMYSAMTVVVLSKSEFSELTTLDFIDKTISIERMSEENRRDRNRRRPAIVHDAIIDEAIVDDAIVDDAIECFSLHKELLDFHLLPTLSRTIRREYGKIQPFLTKTEFYKMLFNCIVRDNYEEHDFDLFCVTTSANIIQEQIKQFGKLSVQNIVQNDLTFDSNDLTDTIYNLGFLVKYKTMALFEPKEHYEARNFHILEFASAFSIWLDIKFNTMETPLTQIVNHFVETKGESLILPFLANLVDDDLDSLLSKFTAFSGWFSLDFAITIKLLSECSSANISKSKYLKNIIPFHKDLFDTNDKDLLNTRRGLLNYGNIKVLAINENTSSNLFTDEIAAYLQIEFELGYDPGQFIAFSKVPCKPQEIFSYPIPFHGPLKKCLRFASSSHIESCALEINNHEYAKQFIQLITKEKTFSKIKYRYLRLEIKTEYEKQVVINLLENNQIQHLDLKENSKLSMSDFSSAASLSTNLTHLSLEDVTVDLHDLTNGGTKKYVSVDLSNCTVTCRQPLLFRKCCDYLQIHGLKAIETITEITPFHLDCNTIALDRLLKRYPAWDGFNRVRYLLLSTKIFKMNYVSSWKNLQTLHLRCLGESTDKEVIAKCIHSLPIIKLIIEIECQVHSNLCKSLNDLWSNKSHLKTIICINKTLGRLNPEIFELFKGLVCNHWDKINLISHKVGLFKIRGELSNLNVTNYNDTCYNDFMDRNYRSISVSYQSRYSKKSSSTHEIVKI